MEILDHLQEKREKRKEKNDGFVNSPPVKGGAEGGGFNSKINYLHYAHLFPVKTETLKKLKSRGNHIIVVEHNMTGQFRNLLQQAGVKTHESWLKYDGRRFYREEIAEKINALSSSFKLKVLFWWRKVFG